MNSMQKMSTQWNQQLSEYVVSKVTKCLEKSKTRTGTKHSKTNWLQKVIEYKADE